MNTLIKRFQIVYVKAVIGMLSKSILEFDDKNLYVDPIPIDVKFLEEDGTQVYPDRVVIHSLGEFSGSRNGSPVHSEDAAELLGFSEEEFDSLSHSVRSKILFFVGDTYSKYIRLMSMEMLSAAEHAETCKKLSSWRGTAKFALTLSAVLIGAYVFLATGLLNPSLIYWR